MTNKVKKFNRCLNHAPNIILVWESENDECPLCSTYEANEKLFRKVEKLKEKNKKLKIKLEKISKNSKKKKKKKKKDDIKF